VVLVGVTATGPGVWRQEKAAMLYDPICGKKVTASESCPQAEYKRRKYYFCSNRCKAAFGREAERIRLHELARVGALLTAGRVRWGMA